MSNCVYTDNSTRTTNLQNISEQMRKVNFDTPAKILQNQRHQFENVSPGISMPTTPDIHPGDTVTARQTSMYLNPPDVNTPRATSPNASKTPSPVSSRPTTPSQFVFDKPSYNHQYMQTHFHHPKKKDTLFHDLKRFFKGGDKERKSSTASRELTATDSIQSSSGRSSDLAFANDFNRNIEGRYGKWGRFVGKGAGGSVRLIRRHTDNKTFAVKMFRKRLSSENEKDYVKKVTAEFCIGSALHHPNVIETLDIIREGSVFFQIMEYAPNDLFSTVMTGTMTINEINCCWRQIVNGLSYMHSVGIAHRDVKLDNVVLDERGILKLIDFGCATVFKYPYDRNIHPSKGISGSDPYIAPEQFKQAKYDARKADVWSCAVVFICMVIKRFPWRIADPSRDQSFKNFVAHYVQGAPQLIGMLPKASRSIITKALDPNPQQRCLMDDIINDPWLKSVNVCEPQTPAPGHVHHLVVSPSNPDTLKRGNVVVVNDKTPSPSRDNIKKSRSPQKT